MSKLSDTLIAKYHELHPPAEKLDAKKIEEMALAEAVKEEESRKMMYDKILEILKQDPWTALQYSNRRSRQFPYEQ